MRMRFIAALLVALNAGASELVLRIDPDAKPKTRDRYIESLHKEIAHDAGVHGARLAILEAMLKFSGGPAWLLEREEPGLVRGVWHYRGSEIRYDIRYDDEHVQIRHHSSSGPLTCENDVGGICYKAHRNFYNYALKMRTLIQGQLEAYQP